MSKKKDLYSPWIVPEFGKRLYENAHILDDLLLKSYSLNASIN